MKAYEQRDMEHAIYISDIKNTKYWSNKYTRLYFGVEFCERLLPTCKVLGSVLRFVEKNSLDFTLVTPYSTERGIKRIRHLLRFIERKKTQCVEVVFNDMGVFNMLKNEYPKFIRVEGRLVSFYAKGYIFRPGRNRYLNQLLLAWFNRNMAKKIQRIPCPSIEKSLVLKSHGINRVDIDAPVLGGCPSPLKDGPKISLYVPYGFIATTRYCPVALSSRGKEVISVPSDCSFPCLNGTLVLKSKNMLRPLLLRGNTYFYKRSLKESELGGVDRLVYQPVLPY